MKGLWHWHYFYLSNYQVYFEIIQKPSHLSSSDLPLQTTRTIERKHTFTWSWSPKCCFQIRTQMNPSSTSLHSKATSLTKIFSPATLLILDMSPSIACTMEQCQSHFACGDFLYHELHNTFPGDDAVHEKNFKKEKSKGAISGIALPQRCKQAI